MDTTITQASDLDRRTFLKLGGGFLLAITMDVGLGRRAMAQGVTTSTVTSYIQIGTDESITVLVGGGEMGQGIYTGLAMGAAEELMVQWSNVKVAPIPASASWLSAGSSGIARRLTTFRTAGATARQMLINAAAQTWGISPAVCAAANGVVTNSVNSASLTYGQLASLASTLPVPTTIPALTPASSFRIIGTPVQRPDIPSKTNGSARYGLDVMIPGMAFAAIKHAPTINGTLAVTKLPVPQGATAIVPLGNAVAVVASNTWAAFQALEGLGNIWTQPARTNLVDSTVYQKQAMHLLGRGTPYIAEHVGNPLSVKPARTLNFVYSFPYLAHACMEVLNCTVRMTPATGTPTACEIWAPTQAPNTVLATAVSVTGLPASAITVYPQFMGGGLGRKFEQDYISQAITTAMAIGKPVKITWRREEDMANDQYRPMAAIRVRAGLDASGNLVSWTYRNVSPSILAQRGATLPATGDSQATEGATALPYAFPNRIIDWVSHPATIPVGFWRSVGYSLNTFATESALDEIALATGTDPVTLRQRLFAASTDPLAPRCLNVLNTVASMSSWGSPVATGHARGIAMSVAFGTIVAQVVEISAPTAGDLNVLNVWCAVDCGTAVNPDSVEAQMQGGIYHGLSAAKWGQITWKAGVCSATNFSHYRVTRMYEAPKITVQIINSGAPMTGCGEPGVPPIGPAIASAYARLTGTRFRSLPFFPGATMSDG